MRMKTCCLSIAGIFGLTLSGASTKVPDARTPVLLELFTSEGCSSCPPADRLLEFFDRNQPVDGATLIVLSEHVDYWDHLGWKDPYSSHQFSERQEQYGRRLHVESVYTPQLVVNGRAQVVGSDAAEAKAAIRRSIGHARVPVTISAVTRKGQQITLHLEAGGLQAKAAAATVYVAIADDEDVSQVSRGENAGRALRHVAVVKSLRAVGETGKDGVFSQTMILPAPSESGKLTRLVVFLQEKNSGQISGVAQELK